MRSWVYVPQEQVEFEVLSKLRGVLDVCTDPQRFTPAVNKELRQIMDGWLRGMDLNHRPLGYEPNELPDCSTPQSDSSPSRASRQRTLPGHTASL